MTVKNLELDLELGRASVIYADERFTVYITVKNISSEPLYMWTFGILESTEFSFVRGYKPPEEFIPYISSLIPKTEKTHANDKKLIEESLPSQGESSYQEELTEDEIKQKSKQDYLKVYYYKDIKKRGEDASPWELSPGESVTDCFFGQTQKSLFFRPDKYKLTLFVDYSNHKDEFSRETKVEEVDILASIRSIIFGAVIGGLLGSIVRFFMVPQDILTLKNLFEIIAAVILSMLAVIALARKTGVQTLVTIQDFWGGILVGFLIGYSGKAFFDKFIGIT